MSRESPESQESQETLVSREHWVREACKEFRGTPVTLATQETPVSLAIQERLAIQESRVTRAPEVRVGLRA